MSDQIEAEPDGTPEGVAGIVELRYGGEFVRLLKLADAAFSSPLFERSLAEALRRSPTLVEQWMTHSVDQRWTPAAYINGNEVGWYDARYQHVTHHEAQRPQ